MATFEAFSHVMSSLTTRQRDLLQFLLNRSGAVVVSDIAESMGLTPRQVTYSLKGARTWLAAKQIELKITPGVGIELLGSGADKTTLKRELASQADYQLVLSAGQRQQLFALNLLISQEPLILYTFQQIGQVSRTTILKDLEIIETWLSEFDLTVERRPNYGIWVNGRERDKRHALTALLWGETLFEDALWQMNHRQGLSFTLDQDVHLLPFLKAVTTFLEQLSTKRKMQLVAAAEADLGGRFSDRAVLFLALSIAVQKFRLLNGGVLEGVADIELNENAIGRVAHRLLEQLDVTLDLEHEQHEVAALAMLLLSCPKSDRWPGDLESDGRFSHLIETMLQSIGEAYRLPELSHDAALRDGLITNVLPACLRERFHIWMPPPSEVGRLDEAKYAFENQLTGYLVDEIKRIVDIDLPKADADNLALLLRAAYIRERPQQMRNVIVVCPSGMATAQLLLARLKVRFPRLGYLTVVSMRELTEDQLSTVDLIISTVPLGELSNTIPIIQVHPQLLPEDIARITEWMS